MIISLEQYFAQEACLRSSQQLETLLVLFCLKCHSAALMNKGIWRGHTQSPILKVTRNSPALLIIRKGSFLHCPPTGFSVHLCYCGSTTQSCPMRAILLCVAWCSPHLCPLCREREVEQNLILERR